MEAMSYTKSVCPILHMCKRCPIHTGWWKKNTWGLNCIIFLMKTIICIHLLLMEFNNYMVHRVPHDLDFIYHLDFIFCWLHSNHLCLLASKHTEFHLSWVIYTCNFLESSSLISSHLWTSYIIWISSSISLLQRGFIWSVYVKHSSSHLLVTVSLFCFIFFTTLGNVWNVYTYLPLYLFIGCPNPFRW